MQSYVVDTTAQGPDAVQTAKKLLKSANITQSQIDSFLMTGKEFSQALGPMAKEFEQISIEKLVEVLSEKEEAVVFFRNHASETRLLQEVNTNSLLFTNMTPSVLSGSNNFPLTKKYL